MAAELKAAGLRRVNVSLDSLNPDTYKRITGSDRLSDVLAGIDAALRSDSLRSNSTWSSFMASTITRLMISSRM